MYKVKGNLKKAINKIMRMLHKTNHVRISFVSFERSFATKLPNSHSLNSYKALGRQTLLHPIVLLELAQ